jgi:hypothetical protein
MAIDAQRSFHIGMAHLGLERGDWCGVLRKLGRKSVSKAMESNVMGRYTELPQYGFKPTRTTLSLERGRLPSLVANRSSLGFGFQVSR